MQRRDFLTGFGAGVSLVGGAYVGWRQFFDRSPPRSYYHISYAQAGEDLAVWSIFEFLKTSLKTYLDVGAYEPILSNNTYFFYEQGARGVLVEPNIDMIPELKKVRPGDTVLNVGIGATDQKEADYFRMSLPQRNTFSREEAERIEAATGKKEFIREVVKIPLVNINAMIAEHFKAAPLHLVSIDTEGFDLPILKSFDFKKHRPWVFCVETVLLAEVTKQEAAIFELMAEHDYLPRGGSLVNTVFVDRKVLAQFSKDPGS